ncbi:MAG: glycerol-3-phosphate 1-O-acyltransferase PlsY [Bacilli bacterium]|nr:glycerol-3-phosphate 1-O-acyltransferase PlsY [Bacilli bacterium]
METFLNVLLYFAVGLGGYLIGSVNNAVIISNLFFKKDIREYGSKNAGGTNAGRVFGRKVGALVMILDVFKSIISYWLITLIFLFTNLGTRIDYNAALHFAMILTALGHCYPVFYKFKGGKAVSVVAGFVVATNWLLTLVGLLIYYLLLKWKRIVSLASILTASSLVLLSLLLLIAPLRQISFYPLASQNLHYYIPTLIGLCILLILKHRTNIERLQKGTENTITWIK